MLENSGVEANFILYNAIISPNIKLHNKFSKYGSFTRDLLCPDTSLPTPSYSIHLFTIHLRTLGFLRWCPHLTAETLSGFTFCTWNSLLFPVCFHCEKPGFLLTLVVGIVLCICHHSPPTPHFHNHLFFMCLLKTLLKTFCMTLCQFYS